MPVSDGCLELLQGLVFTCMWPKRQSVQICFQMHFYFMRCANRLHSVFRHSLVFYCLELAVIFFFFFCNTVKHHTINSQLFLNEQLHFGAYGCETTSVNNSHVKPRSCMLVLTPSQGVVKSFAWGLCSIKGALNWLLLMGFAAFRRLYTEKSYASNYTSLTLDASVKLRLLLAAMTLLTPTV